ncbi:hypothetical protein F5050DRAFT_1713969 [Lentinula boryana]|uniref:Uncharacterized protein n=1 Tax=Lentinula boryana TaxID=40481 RepID=A0ABQ8Q6G3_9AGAR|nr:hypothetical protein F5050DRAFT_1713969 [Lentinula boryana]
MFDKLAKLHSYYAEEAHHQRGKVASSERHFMQIHLEQGLVLEKSGNLDVWEGPMHSTVNGLDGSADNDEPMSGVTVSGMWSAHSKKRKVMTLLLRQLVKAALDCIVPQEVVDMVDVVKVPS